MEVCHLNVCERSSLIFNFTTSVSGLVNGEFGEGGEESPLKKTSQEMSLFFLNVTGKNTN